MTEKSGSLQTELTRMRNLDERDSLLATPRLPPSAVSVQW